MQTLEQRQADLTTALSRLTAPTPVPPHPDLAKVYQGKVGAIELALNDPAMQRDGALRSIGGFAPHPVAP